MVGRTIHKKIAKTTGENVAFTDLIIYLCLCNNEKMQS